MSLDVYVHKLVVPPSEALVNAETREKWLEENDCEICAADTEMQFKLFPWLIVCIVETVLLAGAVTLAESAFPCGK